MTREEAFNRIDALIARHEIDNDYVTITSLLDYDALRLARKVLEQESKTDEENVHREREQAYMQGYEDACKKYRQYPKTGHWIPVSERLPEDNTKVIVTMDATYKEKVIITWYQNKEHDFLCGLVTAWQPLPEPYEPQERSGEE